MGKSKSVFYLLTLLSTTIITISIFQITKTASDKKPVYPELKAASCSCKGPFNCEDLTPYGKETCEYQDVCTWYCPTLTIPPTPSCSGLGVTDPPRQCKCKDCDISGSKLCINAAGTKKQCCINNLSWAHGGCCNKYQVWCGCSSEYPGEVLLFCNGKDLSEYGTVSLKYTSTDGKCPTNPCD